MVNRLNKRLLILGIAAFIAFLIIVILYNKLVETNNAGYYQVKQAAFSGHMSVINEPGIYAKLFGDIRTYQISDMYYFSKHDLDGGDGVESAPITVRFNDGSTAKISGSIKYRLSTKTENQLRLHEDFKNYAAVKQDLIRQTVTEALMQTSTLMKAEDSYSSRRSEFTTVAEGQVKSGIYMTYAKEFKELDAQDKVFIKREVKIKLDDKNIPVIRKTSPFQNYGIEILQFVIKDIDFDATIDSLIAKKKENEQKKVVAKSKAETAKQNAITEEMEGRARTAKARADGEVLKITEVTRAEKEKMVAILQAEKAFKVAQLQAKQAGEKAKKIVAEGKAQATANKLKVAAGLTPQERAEWEYKTKVGVAGQLASVNVPRIVIMGGKDGANANPFDMIGVNMALDIEKRMNNK